MKILFSSLSGHDKTESIHYRRVLTRLNHDVHWISVPSRGDSGLPGTRFCPGLSLGTSLDAAVELAVGTPDLFLYVEPFGLIPEGIERAPFVTACVLCDVHGDLVNRLRLARFFDHVFIYHRNYLPRFTEHLPDHVHWLPYACDLELFKAPAGERDLDIAFIGQVFNERGRVLKRLHERWRMNENRWYLQEEIPHVYGRAKIVVNLPLSDDLNFRVFEALSAGALLLTRRVANGQELLFKEGVHYAAFADEAELFAKVEYYLTHEAERARIAEQGHAEVVAFHGLDMRLRQLLETVTARPEPAAPARRLGPSALDREYTWLYEYWGSVDAGLRVAARARRAGRPWLPLLLPPLRTALRNVRA